MSLLTEINNTYITLHSAKEESFWAQKMALSTNIDGDFEKKEIALQEFNGDPKNLARVRTELERTDLTDEERTGLKGWERFFAVNTIETPEGRASFNHLIELEGALERTRRGMDLGWIDPATGNKVAASSVELALIIQNNPDEATRKSAWEGLRSIEPFVLENGFLDIVKERNNLAHILGYEDYYDYKVTVNEGFNKAKLFELLDDLEQNTRDAGKGSVERLRQEKGDTSVEPWNFNYYIAGDITTQSDPYFRFGSALEQWGRSFAALGINYKGATMQLDLVGRTGKHDNGFMHGPMPTWTSEGRHHPAKINFTANAVPGQVGSGRNALHTLLHEGGHAAHFSNIAMPAPCFSQEFSPTSVAFAETQSMFLDSIMDDPDWLTRYAHNSQGESMPIDLIHQLLEKSHKYRAYDLRKMLAVSYAEKALYEMSPEELTPDNILTMLRDTEQRLLFQSGSPRPLLSIPHLLAGEASAYYHGYTLAQMAVAQTRDYFLKRDGHIMDNPRIGPDLAEKYWSPGNSKTFLELVEDLTGEPFSARATVDLVNRPLSDVFADADRRIESMSNIPEFTAPVELGAAIAVVHGDAVIASNNNGEGFETIAAQFEEWINAA